MSPFMEAALEASRAAEQVIRKYYQQNVKIQIKEDRTPVTEADIETEKVIKDIILSRFPDHGFYGEETDASNIDAEYLWLVDPIDGTKSFVRQYPMFSCQIALMHKGELILGVSNAPCFGGEGEFAHAEKGQGAFLNGEKINVSDIAELRDAALSMGNIATLAGSPQWDNAGKLVQAVSRIRGYGDFYHYHLLASGKIDVIVESDLNILDIAALTVIVREAGGTMTELDGGEINLETSTLLATNGVLLDDVNAILKG